MSTGKWALVIVGVLFVLAGIVMSLQGANYIGGSALMSGVSTYIYVGAVVAIIGLVLIALGFRGRGSSAKMGTVQQPAN
jgi:protein-S-isoprenylcysteine O-methyltransferase Ste14